MDASMGDVRYGANNHWCPTSDKGRSRSQKWNNGVQRWANNSVFEYYSNTWGRILVFVLGFLGTEYYSYSADFLESNDFHKKEPFRTNYNQMTSSHCVFFDESWAVFVLKKCCCTIYIYVSLFQCEFWCALTNQLIQWKSSYSEHNTLTLLPGELSCGASMKFYWTYMLVALRTFICPEIYIRVHSCVHFLFCGYCKCAFTFIAFVNFLSDPGIPGVRSMGPTDWLTDVC